MADLKKNNAFGVKRSKVGVLRERKEQVGVGNARKEQGMSEDHTKRSKPRRSNKKKEQGLYSGQKRSKS